MAWPLLVVRKGDHMAIPGLEPIKNTMINLHMFLSRFLQFCYVRLLLRAFYGGLLVFWKLALGPDEIHLSIR